MFGGIFLYLFPPTTAGRSRTLASHRPSQAFSFLRGPAFLLCGNLLSLDRGNGCALPFIFPGWCVPSGSRSDRAGPGLWRGCWGCMIHSYVVGRGNTATAYLQAGMIRPVPDATADAVVDVQAEAGGESRRSRRVSCFLLRRKRGQRRVCVERGRSGKRSRLGGEKCPAPHCGGARFRRKFIGREYN